MPRTNMVDVENLGDGRVEKTESGQLIFVLDTCERNPIVKPRDIGLTWYEDDELKTGAVFNGGAEYVDGRVILLPRCHRNYKEVKVFDEKLGRERDSLENYISEVWPLTSQDGVNFSRLQNTTIRGDGSEHRDFAHGIEDIRIIKYEDSYMLIGCGKIKPAFSGSNADRIAVYSTRDFLKISYQGMVESFDSRNAVPFPTPVNGNLYTLLRFHPHIHIGLLKAGIVQLLKPAEHKDKWEEIYTQKNSNRLLEAGLFPHEKEKIGPGPQLIKTDRGWLLLYHAVGEIGSALAKVYGLSQKIKRGYSICAALLDPDDPTKVIRRTQQPIYIPSAAYELYGDEEYPVDVPAVVFPVGAFLLQDKLLIYAGAGDKYIILLSCGLERLVDYLWEHCKC